MQEDFRNDFIVSLMQKQRYLADRLRLAVLEQKLGDGSGSGSGLGIGFGANVGKLFHSSAITGEASLVCQLTPNISTPAKIRCTRTANAIAHFRPGSFRSCRTAKAVP